MSHIHIVNANYFQNVSMNFYTLLTLMRIELKQIKSCHLTMCGSLKYENLATFWHMSTQK